MLKKIGKKVVAVNSFVTVSLVTFSAHAAITTADLSPISDSIAADAGTVATWAFGLLGTIMALVIGFKLTKRFIGAST